MSDLPDPIFSICEECDPRLYAAAWEALQLKLGSKLLVDGVPVWAWKMKEEPPHRDLDLIDLQNDMGLHADVFEGEMR